MPRDLPPITQSSVALERTAHRRSVSVVLGLLYGVRACLFDLDEVRTKTAEARAAGTFLAAACAMRAEPVEVAAFEDGVAGVAAGKAGGFGFVVGVDRVGQRAALLHRGADRVWKISASC